MPFYMFIVIGRLMIQTVIAQKYIAFSYMPENNNQNSLKKTKPAALLAVIFPSTTMYPWLNFYCLHTFVIHGQILAFFVWLFMSGEVVPNYKGLWQGALFMILFSVPIYYLNGVFNVNYMFIGMRSDVGVLAALWDAIVPRYGRLVFTVAFGSIMVLVMHVFYCVYFLLGKLRRTGRQ